MESCSASATASACGLLRALAPPLLRLRQRLRDQQPQRTHLALLLLRRRTNRPCRYSRFRRRASAGCTQCRNSASLPLLLCRPPLQQSATVGVCSRAHRASTPPEELHADGEGGYSKLQTGRSPHGESQSPVPSVTSTPSPAAPSASPPHPTRSQRVPPTVHDQWSALNASSSHR